MTWETFYLICFTLGLSLTVLSFAGVFSHLHFGHFHLNLGKGVHTGHVHTGGSAAHSGKSGISPVNGFTLAAFLCWFGGCGYLLERYSDFLTPVVLAAAMVAGVLGAAILFWFLAKVLLPHERELTAEDTAVAGVLGRVSDAIREGGTGEIQFSQNGARRFANARSEAGVAIPRDVEVVVMRYEQGIAWVRRWDEVSEDIVSSEVRSLK
jgi:membrane protein implicated in regulation of membrane protease activity